MSEIDKKEITPTLLRYVLPDDCSDEYKEANAIAAKEVIEAIKDGKDVEIKNVVIEGLLILKSKIIDSEITIERTKIKGQVDYSYATFKQVLSFKNSTFETDANFTAATAEKDIFLDEATFLGAANFLYLTVGGVFYGNSTTFKNGANFNRATFEKGISFKKSNFEEGAADFGSSWVGSSAEFIGARFQQLASFDCAYIEGNAFFKPAIFEGKANYVGVRIGGNAEFTNAVFKQWASFNHAQIKGAAIFNLATFEAEADFGSACVVVVEFPEAVFKQKASFNSVQIEAYAEFRTATFKGEADFIGARIGSNAQFDQAKFEQRAIFDSAQIKGHALFDLATFEQEANFAVARIGSAARFNGATFRNQAIFQASEFAMETSFRGTVFVKDVNFQNTSFRTVFFEELETQFQGKIDLRGCVYDRIEPVSIWKKLMEQLDPYDRQPFTQLEETFRRAGNENSANKVYYKRKRRESAQITIRNPFAWLIDRLHYSLTGYGVQLWRLLVSIAICLLLGTFIFHLKGAVESKPDKQPHSVISPQVSPEARSPLHIGDAFRVSLNLFLPVEIPSGADWKPSTHNIVWFVRFVDFATFLKLAGWIFVPLLVAGLTGFLKR